MPASVHCKPHSVCTEMAEQFWAARSEVQRPRGGDTVLYLLCI